MMSTPNRRASFRSVLPFDPSSRTPRKKNKKRTTNPPKEIPTRPSPHKTASTGSLPQSRRPKPNPISDSPPAAEKNGVLRLRGADLQELADLQRRLLRQLPREGLDLRHACWGLVAIWWRSGGWGGVAGGEGCCKKRGAQAFCLEKWERACLKKDWKQWFISCLPNPRAQGRKGSRGSAHQGIPCV